MLRQMGCVHKQVASAHLFDGSAHWLMCRPDIPAWMINKPRLVYMLNSATMHRWHTAAPYATKRQPTLRLVYMLDSATTDRWHTAAADAAKRQPTWLQACLSTLLPAVNQHISRHGQCMVTGACRRAKGSWTGRRWGCWAWHDYLCLQSPKYPPEAKGTSRRVAAYACL